MSYCAGCVVRPRFASAPPISLTGQNLNLASNIGATLPTIFTVPLVSADKMRFRVYLLDIHEL
jgi:hypothetical protein